MAKYIGKGASISFGDSASGPWTKIPQVETIGELRSQATQVNVTDLDSEEEEFIGSIGSPQSVACSAIWDPANTVHQQVRDDAIDKTNLFYQLKWVDTAGTEIETAVIQGFYLDIAWGPTSVSEALKMPFTIQRSGSILWGGGALLARTDARRSTAPSASSSEPARSPA